MNLILALQVEALAEALALVSTEGLAGERLIEVLQSSMARAAVLDVKAPLMLKNEFPPSFPLRLMHKDIRLALELAKQHGLTLPAASASYSTYDAVKKTSKDDPDYAAVARFWKNPSPVLCTSCERKKAERKIAPGAQASGSSEDSGNCVHHHGGCGDIAVRAAWNDQRNIWLAL